MSKQTARGLNLDWLLGDHDHVGKRTLYTRDPEQFHRCEAAEHLVDAIPALVAEMKRLTEAKGAYWAVLIHDEDKRGPGVLAPQAGPFETHAAASAYIFKPTEDGSTSPYWRRTVLADVGLAETPRPFSFEGYNACGCGIPNRAAFHVQLEIIRDGSSGTETDTTHWYSCGEHLNREEPAKMLNPAIAEQDWRVVAAKITRIAHYDRDGRRAAWPREVGSDG